jgi:hypothetical protein
VIPNPTFEYYGTDEYLVADSRGYVHLLHELAKDFLEHDSNGTITDTRLQLDKARGTKESIDWGLEAFRVFFRVFRVFFRVLGFF